MGTTIPSCDGWIIAHAGITTRLKGRNQEGVGRLDCFPGYWFIRKAMWARESSIRENAPSLKKLQTHLAELDRVSADERAELRGDIKTGVPEWIPTVRYYDDPDGDGEDVWQW